jgi:RNA polymerase sigma-70 factor (ECF subfamily)
VAVPPTRDERFRGLYDEHFEDIRAYCLRRLPVADANDAVAEVFLTVWRKGDGVPDGDVRPWLFTVARNVVLHSKRSLARRARLRDKAARMPIGVTQGPEAETIERSESRRVREALERLPERDREVLRLRVWEELTAAQIATVMGASVSATEKRISRAYKKLERALRRGAFDVTETHSPRGGER